MKELNYLWYDEENNCWVETEDCQHFTTLYMFYENNSGDQWILFHQTRTCRDNTGGESVCQINNYPVFIWCLVMPATLQGLSNNDGPLNGEESRKFTSSVRIEFTDTQTMVYMSTISSYEQWRHYWTIPSRIIELIKWKLRGWVCCVIVIRPRITDYRDRLSIIKWRFVQFFPIVM